MSWVRGQESSLSLSLRGMGFCINNKKLMNMAHVFSSLQWGAFAVVLTNHSCILPQVGLKIQMTWSRTCVVWFFCMSGSKFKSHDQGLCLSGKSIFGFACIQREPSLWYEGRLFSPNHSFILNPSTYKCASRGRFSVQQKIIVLPPH